MLHLRLLKCLVHSQVILLVIEGVLELRTLEFYLISILCIWWQLIIASPRKASIPASRTRGCYYLLSTDQQHHQKYRWLKTSWWCCLLELFEGFWTIRKLLACIFRICCQGRSSESYPSNVGDDSLSNKYHFKKLVFITTQEEITSVAFESVLHFLYFPFWPSLWAPPPKQKACRRGTYTPPSCPQLDWLQVPRIPQSSCPPLILFFSGQIRADSLKPEGFASSGLWPVGKGKSCTLGPAGN